MPGKTTYNAKTAFILLSGIFFFYVSYEQLRERNNLELSLRTYYEKQQEAILPSTISPVNEATSNIRINNEQTVLPTPMSPINETTRNTSIPINNDCNKTAIPSILAPPDTSIIILSNLMPTYPSIQMINETFNSLTEMLDGLPAHTPMYISVDGLLPIEYRGKNIQKLQRYVRNLRLRFQYSPHVRILNNYQKGNISNSIRTALELVQTKFIYVLQHDFPFIKHVNHTGLVEAMRTHPDQLQIVQFGKNTFRKHRMKHFLDFCFGVMKPIHSNGIKFETHGIWSDNNHFTTKAYYEKLLRGLPTHVGLPPEFTMQKLGKNLTNANDCYFCFQYMYNLDSGPFVEHLDGASNATENNG